VVTTASGPGGQPGNSPWRQRLTEDDWLGHLTTVQGWREFTAAETRPPELLSDQQWAALAEDDQFLYDEYRGEQHAPLWWTDGVGQAVPSHLRLRRT
jgi:hypothetical protein